MSTFIFALFFIGLGVLLAWGIKESWNTPPNKEALEKLTRGRRMERDILEYKELLKKLSEN